MNVMLQGRDHFKNKEVICSVEREVNNIYTPNIEDSNAWPAIKVHLILYIIGRQRENNISENYSNYQLNEKFSINHSY